MAKTIYTTPHAFELERQLQARTQEVADLTAENEELKALINEAVREAANERDAHRIRREEYANLEKKL